MKQSQHNLFTLTACFVGSAAFDTCTARLRNAGACLAECLMMMMRVMLMMPSKKGFLCTVILVGLEAILFSSSHLWKVGDQVTTQKQGSRIEDSRMKAQETGTFQQVITKQKSLQKRK